MIRALFFTLSFSLFGTIAQAELKLASPFTDHMVLQRDTDVPVWGWANPAQEVEVSFAGQSKTAKADRRGKWMLSLDALKGTNEGRDFVVKAGKDSVTLKDVVVGEVWICSGQSNMQFGRSGLESLEGLSETGLRSFEVKRTVAFTEQEELEGEWKVEGSSSAVAFAFSHHFARQIDGQFPVGIFLTAWGSSAIEAWMPRDMADEVPTFKTALSEWDANEEAQAQVKAALAKGKWERNDDVFMRRQVNIVYNAMMKPLAPFACSGLIWYQGERNERYMSGMPESPWYHRVGSIEDYDDTLKAWVQRYRKEWQRDKMKFYIVMLPGFETVLGTSPTKDPKHPTAHGRAWMRESQLKVLDLPHTAVANSIDLGHPTNNHPRDKAPIGERLALLAARDVLGKEVEASGPVFDKLEEKGNQLVVHFSHAGGLKTKDGESPQEFWIAGADGKWSSANAQIEGSTVILKSKECPNPKHVRYAFTGMPKVNLVNGADLPAYPFRTDDFAP